MAKTAVVTLTAELLDAIFESARRLYPHETILMLRGKKSKDTIRIEELVVPPLANYGHSFASYPIHMLPMDFSIMGTVHSHPSGNITPSDVDFNHFFGRIMMIIGFPFKDERHIAVYNAQGEKLRLEITPQ